MKNDGFGGFRRRIFLFDMVMVSWVILISGFVGLIGRHRRVINVLLRFEIIMLGLLSLLGL